jgi:hypothetical protein
LLSHAGFLIRQDCFWRSVQAHIVFVNSVPFKFILSNVVLFAQTACLTAAGRLPVPVRHQTFTTGYQGRDV